jgi:uncharacterized protein (DUF983 family)
MFTLKPGTKAYSIFNNKCPRCHQGSLFVKWGDRNYNIFGYTPDKCAVCNQSFVLEQGFYYGSMYISYIIAVALMLPLFIIFYAALDLSFKKTLAIVIIIQLVLSPAIYKFSRSLWINLFVSYDPKYAHQ